MPDLIAQGPERQDRWRRRLPDRDDEIIIGRDVGGWSVPWDRCVSRQHVRLGWRSRRLRVERMPAATNRVYYRGEACDRFTASIGEHFVIGETTFSVVDHRAEVSLDMPQPDNQQTFSADYLREVGFRQAHQQIQVLARLPELITGAGSDRELHERLVNLVLTGLGSAQAAAVVRATPGAEPNINEPATADGAIEILHWDQTAASSTGFQPSAALIRGALRTGESVVHAWEPRGSSPARAGEPEFDWAFCSPIPGNECRNIAIYVAGRAAAPWGTDSLQDALKFVELVGTTVGNLCDVRHLERRAAALSQFFSAPVRRAVAAADPDVVLAPRQAEVSVMFCDLRGFSRRSEQLSGDLFGLLQRVSESLGLVTRQILEYGGVIGDFHGDAAMGFWGWPLDIASTVTNACQAAITIQAAFADAAEQVEHALSDFRVAMGIATGPAVAGKIGTVDQVKVTAFGPVVNTAARLEGLTRFFDLAILVDETTGRLATTQLPPSIGRVRPLARVRPYGMETAQTVYELVATPRAVAQQWDQQQGQYDDALQAFQLGDWQNARQLFANLHPSDTAARFYCRWIDQHAQRPPSDWDGILCLTTK